MQLELVPAAAPDGEVCGVSTAGTAARREEKLHERRMSRYLTTVYS